MKENGILEKAKEGENKYSQASAKEKLEILLADFQVNKWIGETYKEELDKKLQENGMKVEENIVIVDDWKFEIDRSVPKIVKEVEEFTEEKIYSYGNEFTLLTGGFKTFLQGSGGEIIFKDDHINMHTKSPAYIGKAVRTNKKIDFTGANKLVMVYSVNGTISDWKHFGIGIIDTFDSYNDIESGEALFYRGPGTGIIETVEIDVSNIEGNHYIYLYSQGIVDSNIYEIWLE